LNVGEVLRGQYPSRYAATLNKSQSQPTIATTITIDSTVIRGALAADDALKRQGLAIPFRVRETPDWKKHAADLESEMLKRGMRFDVIDWSEDQPPH
jgi:hypothetical protein